MNKHILQCSLLAAAVILSSPASAKPVSYAGGWAPMTMNNGEVNAANIMYSPTARLAIGAGIEYWREQDYTLQSIQMNNLIKRWNNPDSQGNIYALSGIGMAYDSDEDNAEPAAFTGIMMDWEDRRLFTSYENRVTYAGDIDKSFMQSARIGVAPYVGEYGDLHTWLMLQVDHYPEAEDKVTYTPLVRLFKDTTMVEAGMSNTGKVTFNWMYQF